MAPASAIQTFIDDPPEKENTLLRKVRRCHLKAIFFVISSQLTGSVPTITPCTYAWERGHLKVTTEGKTILVGEPVEFILPFFM